jgi:hypothetical protein
MSEGHKVALNGTHRLESILKEPAANVKSASGPGISECTIRRPGAWWGS